MLRAVRIGACAKQHDSVGLVVYTFLEKWLVAQAKAEVDCMAVIWHGYSKLA